MTSRYRGTWKIVAALLCLGVGGFFGVPVVQAAAAFVVVQGAFSWMRGVLVTHCTDDKWGPETLACFAAVARLLGLASEEHLSLGLPDPGSGSGQIRGARAARVGEPRRVGLDESLNRGHVHIPVAALLAVGEIGVTPDAEEHLRSCDVCRREVEQLVKRPALYVGGAQEHLGAELPAREEALQREVAQTHRYLRPARGSITGAARFRRVGDPAGPTVPNREWMRAIGTRCPGAAGRYLECRTAGLSTASAPRKAARSAPEPAKRQ